jgi:hypothetical protein
VSRECLLTRNIIAETFRNDSYIKSMRGTVITSAGGDTLCRINSMLPIRRTSFPMAHPKAVRHVRLHLPSDSLCLGELSFHADGKKIEGVRITSQLNPCRSDEPVSHRLMAMPILAAATRYLPDMWMWTWAVHTGWTRWW